MQPTSWGAQAALGLALTVVVVGVGAGAIWILSTAPVPIYDSPAAVPSTAAAAPSGQYVAPTEASRTLARDVVAGRNLPGLSVAVAVDGEVVWAEGFGWSYVDRRTPITPQTRFRLGALSKPLTAVGAALLHDRGRLDLDAPVQRYVPAYPDKQWTVTTRQLLGDVGGVHRIRGDNNDAMPTTHCASVDDSVDLLAGDPLLFSPGTQHRYSIWGWVLVSAAIEGAAGEPFERYMGQVFETLKMSRTVPADPGGDDGATPLSSPRKVLGVRLGEEAAPAPDYSCLAGGGAFQSTPSDLVRLGSVLLKPGVLKAETITALQTPTRLASGASTTYALGWTVGTAELAGQPTRMISHRGSPRGGTASLLTFPDLGVAVAVASNVTDASGVGPFALQVAETFTRDRHQAPPAPTPGR